MIYIVEDDDNIRKLLCYALTKDGYKVMGFENPDEFKHQMKIEVPELILLDIMLPGEDGLSLLSGIRKSSEYKDLPVIMLTAKGSEFDKVTGLDMGADDYISKPFGMTELLSRVRAVLRRYEKTNTSKECTIGELYVNFKKHVVKVEGEEIKLSFKEYALLTELLEADGAVLTRDELIGSVWGDFYGESRTLDVHIRKLRVKLKSAGDMIKTVKNVGYRFGGAENER